MTTTTTIPWPTLIQGVVGNSCNGDSLISLVLICCSNYVAPERTSRPKHGEEIVLRQLLFKLPTRIHK